MVQALDNCMCFQTLTYVWNLYYDEISVVQTGTVDGR